MNAGMGILYFFILMYLFLGVGAASEVPERAAGSAWGASRRSAKS